MADTSTLPSTLKSLRGELNLTLDELAEVSGVSRAMISRIERDEAAPTTTVLGRLAEALDVSISQLVGGDRSASPCVVRASDQPVFAESGSGFRRRSLSPPYRGRGVDLVLNTLPPGARTGPFPSHRTGVEEHLYVQTGSVRISVGSEAFDLDAGDFLIYPADREHTFENVGDAEAAFFVVIDTTRLR